MHLGGGLQRGRAPDVIGVATAQHEQLDVRFVLRFGSLSHQLC